MCAADATSWTLVHRARDGERSGREAFAALYEPAVRAYLLARWRDTPLVSSIDDAVQDVFVDLFRDGGALSRVERGRPGGFRAYLYGVARIAAFRAERTAARRHARAPSAEEEPSVDELPADIPGVSTAFDRAWATSMVREAGARQREQARERGPEALRRVEILRLRFEEGLAIRDIARRWNEDPARVHHEYARARRDFRDALLEVVTAHHPGAPPEEVEREAEGLLRLLA